MSDNKPVTIPQTQLEIVKKHFNKLNEMKAQINRQEEQLMDVFQLLDSMHGTMLARGTDVINPDGSVTFGPREPEDDDHKALN